jgi:cystathionine beta-lyase/cystathionine gamma-synthase
VGLEDPQDLIADLGQALVRAESHSRQAVAA